MIPFLRAFITTAALLAAAFPGHPTRPPGGRYSVREIGSFGGNDTRGLDLNNRGQVVGWSETRKGNGYGRFYHAFVWKPGAGIRDLGTLGGPYSSAEAINERGEIAGWADARFELDTRAVVWHRGKVRRLGRLPGDRTSGAVDISEQGRVLCWSITEINEDIIRPALWVNGALLPYGDVPPQHSAVGVSPGAMNESGVAVGAFAYDAEGKSAAFLKDGEWVEAFPPHSRLKAINDSGVAVGWGDYTTGYHALRWSDGVVTSLGLGGAFDINENGDVVGASRDVGTPDGTAALWRNGSTLDLNTAVPRGFGWFLWAAWAINDRGQIVASGHRPNAPWRVERAFLLTPR